MTEVTKDMRIGDLLQMNDMIAPFLMQNGMGCVFCPSSMGESLEEACMVHGLDSDMMVADLNDVIREYEETHNAQ
ncbi:MAG TPA: disulfide oxidoreductase [Oribacterium sp.]|jgi:hybrid cluster-associated redox disulfide protein|nr:disulfide oxidoreductase [Oribacterium sp.]